MPIAILPGLLGWCLVRIIAKSKTSGSTAEQLAASGSPWCGDQFAQLFATVDNEGSTGYRLFSPCRDAAVLRSSDCSRQRGRSHRVEDRCDWPSWHARARDALDAR